jgi:hypothetical protein
MRNSLLLDSALQLRGSALALGIEREASPYGGAAEWIVGGSARVASQFWLGVQARPQSADLQLRARQGRLRFLLAVAASGAQSGGVALATEWLR